MTIPASNSTTKTVQQPTLALQPSRRLGLFYLLVHGAAGLGIIYMAWFSALALPFLLAVLWSARGAAKQVKMQQRISAIALDNAALGLVVDNQKVRAELTGVPWVSEYLVVVRIAPSAEAGVELPAALLLFCDALGEQQHRALRVYCNKHRAGL